MVSPWYQIRAHADVADVEITGPIQSGDAHKFIAALPSTARTIRLHVSSLGGDPVAAMQITHALKGHPARVEVRLSRICASAATLLPCAAGHVRVESDAAAMIHAPRAVPNDETPLTARRLRTAATELESIRNQMAAIYAWRLKGGRDAIARLVDDENGAWFDARESVALGLADEVVAPAVRAVAMFTPADLATLGTIPPRFRGLFSTLTRTAVPTSRASTPAPATRFAVELGQDERPSLEGVRDQLTRALDNLHAVVGDAPASASARMYARYNVPRILSAVDEDERAKLEAARDDVNTALDTVRKLLGEPAPSARFDARSAYARLNTPGPLTATDIYRTRQGAQR